MPVHVRFLLDEFANIGQIPNFDKLIATIRSREISACVILQTQSQLKTMYNGFTPFHHVSDDGYSGTNWNRPGWQELMAKIESGQVENLLVKDSSRLGRDHLRVGLFRELLAEKGIRLIAVNDGLDSARGEDDFTPFRDIMAEWYSRDCSRKMRSSLQTKGKKGIPLSSRPPYGYIRNPNDKNSWLVDEPAAVIVRRIYNLTVKGKPPFEICRILHAEKVERPSYYLTKNGYANYAGALDAKDPYAWVEDNVKTILSREEYLGHVVNFRVKKASFKSKKHYLDGIMNGRTDVPIKACQT